jgi:hypothetical protein
METRSHDPFTCDCNTCNPDAVSDVAPDLCSCVEDGFRASLESWRDSCSCCFSEAFPNGIDAAIAAAREPA